MLQRSQVPALKGNVMRIDKRRSRCRELVQRYYKDVPTREELLEQAIGETLDGSTVLLDAGCGADLPLLARHGPKARISVGVDLSAPALAIPPHTYPLVGDLGALPLQSDSVDLLISRSVLEHLENPMSAFQEFSRVLRPNGMLVCTTPNKYYYSCLIARLIPESIKAQYFRTVFGEDAYDHFPVHYRANTVKAFRKLASSSQLTLLRVEPIRHYPYYLMFSPLLFRLGMFYDWFITAWRFDALQSNWLVVMRKG